MKIAYAILYTSEIDRAVRFYRMLLNEEPRSYDERFAEFQIGEALLGLKKSAEQREIPGHQTVILECRDIETVYKLCAAENIPIAKTLSTESWGRNFAILDPDTNKVEFVQQGSEE